MMFDPNTYDPFAGYDENREANQRLNQTLREAGQPVVVWPDDLALVNQMAAETSAHDLHQTRNHDLRRLASSTVEQHLKCREQLIDPPASGLRVLLAFDVSVALPIAELSESNHIAEQYLSGHHMCDVRSDRRCSKVGATHVLRVVFGDFVCLYKSCETCVLWFGNPVCFQDSVFGVSWETLLGDHARHPASQ